MKNNKSENKLSLVNQIYCRTYQKILYAGSYILPWHTPKLVEGLHSLELLPTLISNHDINNVLIVTDKNIVSHGLLDELLICLNKHSIMYSIFDKTIPNPTNLNVEEALLMFKQNNCQALVAIGGGSPMDCAKGVGARVAKHNKSLYKLQGLLKIRKKIPLLFAVPTTAGTGSETTLAAVITDVKTHKKYPINDICLIPDYAILDPFLTVDLPPNITAETGIDALTHAIEAFLGNSNTRETKELSKKAVKIIFDNIQIAYNNGNNIPARSNMLKASYMAGAAFTRAYVGYVHAISHALSGLYGVPHGRTNATILPVVLEYYGDSVYKKLAELADIIKITQPSDNMKEKSEKFIKEVKKLNKSLDIPKTIPEIKQNDIPLLAERALNEANPFYPVPKLFSNADIQALLYIIA